MTEYGALKQPRNQAAFLIKHVDALAKRFRPIAYLPQSLPAQFENQRVVGKGKHAGISGAPGERRQFAEHLRRP